MNLIPLAIQYPCEFNTPLDFLWGFLFSIYYARIAFIFLRYLAKCCIFFASLIYIYDLFRTFLNMHNFAFFFYSCHMEKIFLLCLWGGKDTTTTKST